MCTILCAGAAETLKTHGIFRSNMVLQRDKPITIWGWAPVGSEVKVSFGKRSAKAKTAEEKGRWQVTFDVPVGQFPGTGTGSEDGRGSHPDGKYPDRRPLGDEWPKQHGFCA